MKLSFTSQEIDKVTAELVVLMHYQDQLPLKNLLGVLDWRINGRLSRVVQNKTFQGKPRELLLMPSEARFKASQILVLGLGQKSEFNEDHINEVLDYFIKTVENKRAEQVCFSLHQLLPSQFEWRNAVRILLSKLVDCQHLKEVILREPVDVVRDAKRRQINVGPLVKVEYH